MAKYSFYPQNPRWNSAAVLLSMMTPDQIDDVISLIGARGRQVIMEVKSTERSSSATLSPLSVLDSKFVPSEDLEDVAMGLNTVLLAQLRTPKFDRESYEKVLAGAFSLDSAMAAAIAAKIETSDILGASYKDASGAEYPWYKSFTANIMTATRTVLNKIPELFGIPWEIESRQDFDMDLLYELKLLGAAVSDLNSRARLMAGQAAFNMSTGYFAMGDVEEGDVDESSMGDIMLGDALRGLSLRSVPSEVFGSAKGLARITKEATANKARAFGDAVGMTKDGAGEPSNPAMKNALDRLLNAKPGKAVAIGAALGLTPLAFNFIKQLMRGTESGDIDMTDIAAKYGNTAAENWLTGDVEGFISAINDAASEQISTGDPALDSALEGAIMQEMMGDIEDMGPETGAVFARARINTAKKRESRRIRRSGKKMSKQSRKNVSARNLDNARMRAATAGMDAEAIPYEEEAYPDEEQFDDEY